MIEIIEGELSYKIIGFCFRIHSEIGKSAKEKYYQRALELDFIKNKIPYNKELKADLLYNNDKIGHYFLDFLVDGKIIVEVKAKPFVNKNDFKQVLEYLKEKNIRLGLLINFGEDSLKCKRVINYKYSH